MNLEQIINTYDTVFGFLAAIAVAFIVKKTWSRKAKTLVALGFALVYGVVRTYIEGKLNFGDTFATVAYTWSVTLTFYGSKVIANFLKYIEENHGNVEQTPLPESEFPELGKF